MSTPTIIDAIGLQCPLPVLRLRKVLLGGAEDVVLLADDPVAVIDVPHFCAEAGYELVEATQHDDHTAYHVRMKKRPAD